MVPRASFWAFILALQTYVFQVADGYSLPCPRQFGDCEEVTWVQPCSGSPPEMGEHPMNCMSAHCPSPREPPLAGPFPQHYLSIVLPSGLKLPFTLYHTILASYTNGRSLRLHDRNKVVEVECLGDLVTRYGRNNLAMVSVSEETLVPVDTFCQVVMSALDPNVVVEKPNGVRYPYHLYLKQYGKPAHHTRHECKAGALSRYPTKTAIVDSERHILEKDERKTNLGDDASETPIVTKKFVKTVDDLSPQLRKISGKAASGEYPSSIEENTSYDQYSDTWNNERRYSPSSVNQDSHHQQRGGTTNAKRSRVSHEGKNDIFYDDSSEHNGEHDDDEQNDTDYYRRTNTRNWDSQRKITNGIRGSTQNKTPQRNGKSRFEKYEADSNEYENENYPSKSWYRPNSRTRTSSDQGRINGDDRQFKRTRVTKKAHQDSEYLSNASEAGSSEDEPHDDRRYTEVHDGSSEHGSDHDTSPSIKYQRITSDRSRQNNIRGGGNSINSARKSTSERKRAQSLEFFSSSSEDEDERGNPGISQFNRRSNSKKSRLSQDDDVDLPQRGKKTPAKRPSAARYIYEDDSDSEQATSARKSTPERKRAQSLEFFSSSSEDEDERGNPGISQFNRRSNSKKSRWSQDDDIDLPQRSSKTPAKRPSSARQIYEDGSDSEQSMSSENTSLEDSRIIRQGRRSGARSSAISNTEQIGATRRTPNVNTGGRSQLISLKDTNDDKNQGQNGNKKWTYDQNETESRRTSSGSRQNNGRQTNNGQGVGGGSQSTFRRRTQSADRTRSTQSAFNTEGQQSNGNSNAKKTETSKQNRSQSTRDKKEGVKSTQSVVSDSNHGQSDTDTHKESFNSREYESNKNHNSAQEKDIETSRNKQKTNSNEGRHDTSKQNTASKSEVTHNETINAQNSSSNHEDQEHSTKSKITNTEGSYSPGGKELVRAENSSSKETRSSTSGGELAESSNFRKTSTITKTETVLEEII